jgi:protein ImuA
MLRWEGFKPACDANPDAIGLGMIEHAFPNRVFPTATIHEFIIGIPEHAAATGGFIAGLLKSCMKESGICLWISTSRSLFPPALKMFGIEPHRIIFIDLTRQKDVLWATEEALKCEGISAVIAELEQVSFAESRRLQLAVEKSRVTGFIMRTNPNKVTATACTARWKITPLPSELEDNMPGVGFPRWNIELLKVRNGNPGSWKVEWSANHFSVVTQKTIRLAPEKERRKAG